MRGTCILDGDEARVVAVLLERGARDVERSSGAPVPPFVHRLLAELRLAGADLPPGIPGEGRPVTVPTMSATAAANLLGITSRAVRGLAHRETLPGVLTPAGWRFDPDDVAAYRAARGA